jgi:UDP-N-acetylglucosamine diphosphorylase / glucose-1-phosphate thymidylyltransferase / UDP-N-acetylgalactosamine diphosphorylase / glucosamine-1-phosphate N-acetyltransferase / galactosamine-1-phosphate N-acetyltransferase
MIIIIPIGGIGQRFKENDYKKPKALINIYGKPIISYLLDNLNTDNIDYIFIPYNKEYKNYRFEDLLIKNYPKINFRFYCLENNTRGAAETINIGINNLNEERDIPVLCLDSDNFYTCDIISQWNGENCIFSFEDENENPIYSYIKTNENNEIIDIKEKEKISNNACTGAYGFLSINELKKYTSKIIEENITQKSEFYTSGVIKQMINEDVSFKNINILNKHYFSLGTPEQVNEYKHPFIFDLDGTLVDTDDIYVTVWNFIMTKYDLSIDENFFKFFIQGKNDIFFLKSIFPNIKDKEIWEISNLKDSLFIDYLKDYNEDIMINGAKKFIQKNKNRRMCVVTSCNKKAAEYILKKTNLYDYMQFLIASEDCNKHKPNKEPYERAINILQCSGDCTIFEDSNSGYKSAMSVGNTNICLILNNKSSDFIIKSNEYKINSYDNFDINYFNDNNNDSNNGDKIKKLILTKLDNIPIKDVIFDNIDMKTGYICDIKSLTLYLNNNNESVVLKIENYDNDLSIVAREINLYKNEVKFYEKISNIVDIKLPKFYCSLVIDNKNAILLENLNNYKGVFNINLNKNIDIILLVVKNITEMHNRFYYKNEEEIIPIMKDLFKINEITYYKELVNKRYGKFLEFNNFLLTNTQKKILKKVFNNYSSIIDIAGRFPLNFCHGDLKSPNIFYKEEQDKKIIPIFLDWQYIHLNKGISDIVFLLIESTDFDEELVDIIIKYYYKKSIMYENIEDLLNDFKISLCIFPFFVMIWFNSENRDNLLDKVFPISFMKNTLKFYEKFLDDKFFNFIKLNL